MIRGLTSGLISGLISPLINIVKRWVYNFDGVDDRATLQFRAINPDGDIDIEWRSGPTVSLATSRTIVSQTLTTVAANQEFFMFVATNGNLAVRVGGVERGTNPAIVYQPNTKYRWRLRGTDVNFWINDVLQPVMSLTRGTAREPTAVTQIGATANTFFYLGELYDVRINGVLYPIADRNQGIQLPSPSGLGPELITQSVLENPFFKGTQWNYLGQGSWQLTGDGSLNELIFISATTQPAAGFLEFEIESITGTLMCTVSSTAVLNEFSTPGVKRYFYTQKALAGNPNSQAVTFKRRSGSVTCVIKNIGFKPLWVANATELVANGDFSSSAGWTVGPNSAITGGVLQITSAASSSVTRRDVSTDNTKRYELRYTVSAITGGAVRALS